MEVILLCYIMVTTADGHELTTQMSYLYIIVVFRQETHSSLTWYMGSSDGKTQYNSDRGVYILHSPTKKKPIIGTSLVLTAANLQSFWKHNVHRMDRC